MKSREAISYCNVYIILGMRSVRGVCLVSCRKKKKYGLAICLQENVPYTKVTISREWDEIRPKHAYESKPNVPILRLRDGGTKLNLRKA